MCLRDYAENAQISLRGCHYENAFSNILKILQPKGKLSDKNSDNFHISAQNID